MTLKESAFVALAVVAAVALFLFVRDSATRAALLAVLRRKQTEDLAAKIKEGAAKVRADIAFTEARLQEEAERYRSQKLDESPAAIKAYYEKFFSR